MTPLQSHNRGYYTVMGWYEALKDALEVADHLKDADLKHKLATVQMECAALAEENSRLREERLELRRVLSLKDEMIFDPERNVYSRTGAGAFCPKCWDGERKQVRMLDYSKSDHLRCSVCDLRIPRPGKHPTDSARAF